MSDIFDIRASGRWSFSPEASTVLDSAQLAQAGLRGVKYATGARIKPQHDALYWERATAGLDFSGPDRVPPGKFNRLIWKGLMGDKPYPVRRGPRSAQSESGEQSKTR